VRFAPTVHGDGDNGFMAAIVATARARAVSAYIGDGTNRWAAIHRSDAGRIVGLALDKQVPGGTILHAAAETGVSARDIAGAIGRGLGLPVAAVPADQAGAHFGWLSRFYGADMAASSDATRSLLGWTPSGPHLIEDLDSDCYYR
jgi:nucleoside-diphosphate-sugar epimerase